MATSSILTNVKITDPRKAEMFINALEASSKDPKRVPSCEVEPPLTDKAVIRDMFAKRRRVQNMIKANEYIKTGFSANDAEKLDAIIQPLFAKGQEIIVDFEGINIFTTLFFNNVFAKYITQIGSIDYDKQFKLLNLTELGESTYKHSYDNAVNYYNLSLNDKKNKKIY